MHSWLGKTQPFLLCHLYYDLLRKLECCSWVVYSSANYLSPSLLMQIKSFYLYSGYLSNFIYVQVGHSPLHVRLHEQPDCWDYCTILLQAWLATGGRGQCHMSNRWDVGLG